MIAGYRIAISEAHELVDGVLVGTHPDISWTMHAIHSENPPPVKSDDLIDIIPSLDYIRSLEDNSTMLIRNLTVKTSFLIALVTASRPLDLKRIDLFTLKITRNSITLECIKPKEYNIAKAHSLSSTKSPAFITLIDRTRQWRDTEDKKKSLFLITREPYSPAATDTIAGWIKTVYRNLHPPRRQEIYGLFLPFFCRILELT
ncbi:hypothetical protein C1646_684437 [Rhizophagus diaphanus]|nr:hypothetical protein C1646_684437 [Rhizophagus diaphanus] [Rhizophagus sp. MUCL 43196]